LYRNEEEARAVGARMASKGRGKTRPYLCPKCDGWHLTSLIKPKRPK